MRKNLLPKTLFIVGTLLVFVYGILLGTDPDKAVAAWKEHGALGAIQENIHLGLDLKGGTHLILQVAVNEAVNADTDRTLAALKEDLGKAGVSYTDLLKPDPANHPEVMQIRGVAPDKISALRSTINDNFQQYDLQSGANGTYQIVMKPSEVTSLKQRAVQQAIETIRNRVDQFGVSEPTIQQHGLGDYQILVELPGVDDPARVKDLIQSTAMLEIRQSMGGPYPDEQSALQANSGTIAPDQVILPGATGQGGVQPEYWLISRSSAVAGRATINAAKTYVQDLATSNVLAGFSSRGPTDVDFRIKPDVTSPGVNVLSSIPGSGPESCVPAFAVPCWAFFQGTSMATPHLAGSAAVVLGQHPSWPAWAVRSAVVNTADENVLKTSNGTCCDTDVNDVGSGRENLGSAVNASLAFDPVSVSFGAVPSGSGQTKSMSVTVMNLTSGTLALPATSITGTTGSGVAYSVSGVPFSLPAGGTATITVTMSADKGASPDGHQAILRFRGLAHAALFTWIK